MNFRIARVYPSKACWRDIIPVSFELINGFAEFETNLRRERQLEGISAAKARGVYKGRRPSIDAAEVLRLRREEQLGPAAIARRLGIVVLHGCDGVGPHYREWARRLAGWGYAALLIDSFGPRGFKEVCNQGLLVPPEAQARDAFDGAAYLRTAPAVRALQVGVIGFSHGGWAVLKAVLAGLVRHPREPPFAAAVAYYPGCDPRDPPGHSLETDTLILIGDADDWTPVTRCIRWRAAVQTNGHVLQMRVYPGARHGFDAPRPLHFYAGHFLGQDPVALALSLIETRRFLDQRLNPHR